MNCPFCSNLKSKVTDKRTSPKGIRRRRECLKCKKRFTTYEKIGKNELYVIKKDGKREKFDREKIEKGIDKAFEKRPISKEKIDKMIDEIEEQLR
ncbi:MAG TPA: ATP cone domain-containing protein, partial [Candidatus Paceibacterota bacterium]|nr:ATP cone domain-containing protein [Candidatus Paceibacterota bacterium]